MKKILKSFLFAALGLFALASCEDVPAPYEIPSEGGNTGGGVIENGLPYISSNLYTGWSTQAANDMANPWSQGNSYTQATGYQKWDGSDTKSNRATEGYLVSPSVNTKVESGKVKMSYEYCVGYANNDANFANHIKVYVSSTYIEGEINLADWIQLDWKATHTSTDWTLKAEEVQLPDAFANQENVHIAFWFCSPADKSCTFELMSFKLLEGVVTGGITPDEPNKPDTPTVEAKGDGTLENPFNPAGANAFVAAGENLDREVYIKGVVSKVRECSAQYGNASFYITEDGTGEEENSFLVWRAAGLDNKKVDSDDYVKLGDEVIVKGLCVNYNGTYETAQGKAYIYSLTRKDNGGQAPDEPNTEVGSDLTIDLSTFGYDNAADVAEVKSGDVTLLFAQNGGNNAPKYYSATNGVRMYALNSLTITAKKQMKGVKLVCDSYSGTDYVGNATLYAEPGQASVSGTDLIVSDINAAQVNIVNHHTGNSGGVQLRVKKVVIDYAD